jgi:hypothetical protein
MVRVVVVVVVVLVEVVAEACASSSWVVMVMMRMKMKHWWCHLGQVMSSLWWWKKQKSPPPSTIVLLLLLRFLLRLLLGMVCRAVESTRPRRVTRGEDGNVVDDQRMAKLVPAFSFSSAWVLMVAWWLFWSSKRVVVLGWSAAKPFGQISSSPC